MEARDPDPDAPRRVRLQLDLSSIHARMQSSAADASPRVTAPSALLVSALKAGTLTGGAGVLLGSAQGIIASKSPALFAAFAGVQWFTAGTAYWAIRSAILNRRGLGVWYDITRGAAPGVSKVDTFSQSEKVQASTVAGGFSGGIVAAVTRSRAHIIPGAVMFSLFGFAGQHLYSFLDSIHAASADKPAEGKSWFRKLADSRFSPVKVLSEGEYEQLLREKLLKVQVELALVDEAIEELRQQNSPKK
ncbi:uncharacterized protein BKCO1_5800072 [Diplodia corticola]|uniref:Beta-ketoacyl synthase n=1 Tax=Diplodia corticola TaxID=236234 RepID=A0A1J9RSV7_9PEZI|nr:uncharacterized protein BKCO1_5800072 [Diplodia corticola]OJD30621.1 hypothetical protein BKCO1_5800072 [Diplodia corticola]